MLLEKEVESAIMRGVQTDIEGMKKNGFPVFQEGHVKFLSQVQIKNHGIADIIAIGFREDDSGNQKICITIYEIKRAEVSADTISQACRYASGIHAALTDVFRDEYLGKLEGLLVCNKDIEVNMVCMGSSVRTQVNRLLENANVYFYKFSFDALNGMRFEPVRFTHFEFGGKCSSKSWASVDLIESLDWLVKSVEIGEKLDLPFSLTEAEIS